MVRRITYDIELMETCPVCEGAGYVDSDWLFDDDDDDDEDFDCARCGGLGLVPAITLTGAEPVIELPVNDPAQYEKPLL